MQGPRTLSALAALGGHSPSTKRRFTTCTSTCGTAREKERERERVGEEEGEKKG
jgi:hypothetical protein